MSEPSVPPPPSYAPPPPPAGGAVSPNRGLMIVLSYLWILAIVPLITEKEDREVQWHAKHGLVLLVVDIIAWVAVWILTMVLSQIDFLSCAGCVLPSAFWVADLVIRILCIMKGVNGQRFIIPGISQYADRF